MMTPQPMSPQQAPPPGGPQMPPPQPGQPPQMQGADPQAMLAQMKAMGDPQLQQLVQSKHPLGSFALVMLNGRNQQRKAAQAQQMQQVAQQPPVAQRVMQESQGIAGLPTGQAIPQQYAEGGIVRKFEGGGSTSSPTAEEWYVKLLKDSGILVDRNNPEPETQYRFGNAPGVGGSRTVGFNDPRVAQTEPDWMGNAAKWVADKVQRANADSPLYQTTYSNEGRGRELSPEEAERIAANGNQFANVQGGNTTFTRPGIAQGPVPGAGARSASAGIGMSSRGGAGGAGFPAWSDPTKGAPAARMTDEEWTAFARKKTEELTAMYGPSYAAKYLAEMQAERDKLKERGPRAREEAWLTAGLRMMQGKSRHGLQNIGAGGEAGIAQYRADRTDAENRALALRREMMGLEASDQARKDNMVTAGIGQANTKNSQMGEDRKERIGVNESQTQHGIKGAMYALEQQKVAADMVRAQAAMKAAGAAAAASQDAKMMNAVTMAEKRIDAAVKQRMAGHVFIQPGQEQALYAKYYTEEFNNALATNPFFREAVTGNAGGATIDAAGMGLGKKQ